MPYSRLRATTVLLAVLASAPAQARHGDPDQTAGDVIRLLNPAGALLITMIRRDPDGLAQWLRSTGATVVTTELLKRGLNDTAWGERPNGGEHSFPSGHAALACSGAAYLQQRYGWSYGGPAYALAAYASYTRVLHDKHHWRDVIAGCALAAGFAELFVSRRQAFEVSAALLGETTGLLITVRW